VGADAVEGVDRDASDRRSPASRRSSVPDTGGLTAHLASIPGESAFAWALMLASGAAFAYGMLWSPGRIIRELTRQYWPILLVAACVHVMAGLVLEQRLAALAVVPPARPATRVRIQRRRPRRILSNAGSIPVTRSRSLRTRSGAVSGSHRAPDPAGASGTPCHIRVERSRRARSEAVPWNCSREMSPW
jgi:hypothetical protein